MDPYPVGPARALPAAAYRDESFAIDIERVWRTSWVWVAAADEVAEPGDHVAVTVGGQPVIVLRRQDGQLAAMSNMCAHRGTLLVDGRGNAKRFQCPYHAWTFADDGRLLAAPYTDRSDVEREAHCLPTYRAEEWHGLVFVSLRTDIEPLAELLAHLDQVVAPAQAEDLHDWTSTRRVEVWDANWKLVLSNAMESYHLFQVHEESWRTSSTVRRSPRCDPPVKWEWRGRLTPEAQSARVPSTASVSATRPSMISATGLISSK